MYQDLTRIDLAIRDGKTERNPVTKIRMLKEPSGRVRYLTDDEERRLLAALVTQFERDRVVVLTAGPGTVKGTYEVDLPRPRNVAEIRFQPRFAQIYEAIWSQLRDEVLVSYERQKHGAAV